MRAAIAILCLFTLQASADTAGDAKSHYQRATSLFAVGDFGPAAIEYEAAYKLKPDPALLYNAAQSHRLAGNLERALVIYKNYINLYPKASNLSEVRAQITKLESAVAADESAKRSPPHSVVLQPSGREEAPPAAPAQAAPPPAPAPQTAQQNETPAKNDKPVYKKWWLWTAVVGGVLVVGAVATAVAVTQTHHQSWADIPSVGPGKSALTVSW